MVSNVENIDSCPKCSARLLVFTFEGPDQYLSCVKCSWKIQAKKSVAPKVAKAKKRLSKKNKEPISSESRPKLPDRQPKYNYSLGTQLPATSIPKSYNIESQKKSSKSVVPLETATCESCLQVNRFPMHRRLEAKCGRCGAKLFSDSTEKIYKQTQYFPNAEEKDSPWMIWFWKALLLSLGWLLFSGVFIEGSLKPQFIFGFGLGGVITIIWFFLSHDNPRSIIYRPSIKTFLFCYVIVSFIIFLIAVGSDSGERGGRSSLIYEGFR